MNSPDTKVREKRSNEQQKTCYGIESIVRFINDARPKWSRLEADHRTTKTVLVNKLGRHDRVVDRNNGGWTWSK